jgi:hypothetical protein
VDGQGLALVRRVPISWDRLAVVQCRLCLIGIGWLDGVTRAAEGNPCIPETGQTDQYQRAADPGNNSPAGSANRDGGPSSLVGSGPARALMTELRPLTNRRPTRRSG